MPLTGLALNELNRRELQEIAKVHGIKANAKSEDIIHELTAVLEEEWEDDDEFDDPCDDPAMQAAFSLLRVQFPEFPDGCDDNIPYYSASWLWLCLEEHDGDVEKVSAMLREKLSAVDKLKLEFPTVHRGYLFQFLEEDQGDASAVSAMLREKLGNPRFAQIVANDE